MVEHFRTYRVLEPFLYLLFEELENILLTFIPGFSYTSFKQFPKIHTRTFLHRILSRNKSTVAMLLSTFSTSNNTIIVQSPTAAFSPFPEDVYGD